MIIQIFDKNVMKILTIFSISPGSKFQRKELKEKTSLNNITLDNSLKLLFNSNILKKEKRALYLNLESKNTKSILELVSNQYKELKEIPLKAYFSVIELVYLLSKFELNVYVFGSYAKLVFKEDSDIDIAIISDKISSEEKREISKLIKKIESKYKRKIEIHYFSTNFYKNKKDPLVKDILINGIKLI